MKKHLSLNSSIRTRIENIIEEHIHSEYPAEFSIPYYMEDFQPIYEVIEKEVDIAYWDTRAVLIYEMDENQEEGKDFLYHLTDIEFYNK